MTPRRITSKTPLRISFVGGLTDLPAFYKKYGGEVISTTINKYIVVTVDRRFDGRITVDTSAIKSLNGQPSWESAYKIDELENPYVRETLRESGVKESVAITIESDTPAGSGLGGSSALIVGLLNALTAYKTEMTPSHKYLAETASEIEIETLNHPIGKQDQYAATYGGFNRIIFDKNDAVSIQPITPPAQFEKSLMLFYTGIQRYADDCLKTVKTSDPKTLLKIKAQVGSFYRLLIGNNASAIGGLLDATWQQKKQASPNISSAKLDRIYSIAISAGALGGKVLGAGGGGHILFYVPEEKQQSIIEALNGIATHRPFQLKKEGTQLI